MPVVLWTSDAFLAEATAWAAAEAARVGLVLTGEREQPHARPWSSAIRFETDGGRLWFKVNGPGTIHEAALVGTLGRVVPDLVPQVLAVDAERGWSLMRDAGPVLRTVAEPDRLWGHWEELLPVYAEAQRTLAAHTAELLAERVREVSPTTMPVLARRLLADLAHTPVDEGGLTAEEAKRADAALSTYDEACAELAASGLPDTISHDDLHSSNVCWGEAGPRIIDWGDAIVGHPLGTMLATINSVAWHAKTERDDPRVLRVRDAYLSGFPGTHEEQLRWVELARYTGVISKALAYVQAFEGEPLSAQAGEEWPVREWFLDIIPG